MDKKTPTVVSAKFLTSAAAINQSPNHDLLEIAITGRSNVGKSSLINALCNIKNLAKTSKTPGKTRLINFFEIKVRNPDFTFCLVDLPGYGYARVSKTEQERWGKTIESFLLKRRNLVAVGQLIDTRHPPTPLDYQMREWLVHSSRPVITVLTKADKVSRLAGENMRRTVAVELLSPHDPAPVLFSSVNRQGVGELLEISAGFVIPAESD